MASETQSGMHCAQVEAVLAEALDGSLQASALAAFQAHQQTCPSCRGLVEEARAGMQWLKSLQEAEPPRNLMHNILAQTIGALPSEHLAPAPRCEDWAGKLRARVGSIFAPVATPRFAMSFGMAFFSITMLLGIAGFHFADIRHLDVSSKGIRKAYYATEARVMRYYENMRLVYEIESRVRDLRQAATPAPTPDNQQQKEVPATKNPSKTENQQQRHTPNDTSDNVAPELAACPGVQTAAERPGFRPAAWQGELAATMSQARQNWRTV